MTNERILLSERERSESERRIAHDAWLIEHGASIDAFGRLVVTQAQLAELNPTSEHNTRLSEWLDADSSLTYKQQLEGGRQDGVDNRVLRELEWRKLHTIRSVLAVGVWNAVAGEKSQAKLRTALANPYGIELPELDPSVEYIARICSSLDEIPGLRVHRRVQPGYSIQDILTRASQGPAAVEAITDYSQRYRSRWDVPYGADARAEIAQNVLTTAQKFATEFTELTTR